MKILVVCQYYYPEPFRISDICEELVKRGHEVMVLTGEPNYPEGIRYSGYNHGEKTDEVINGVKVHRCYTVPRKTGSVYRLLNYYSYAKSSVSYVKSGKCLSNDGSPFDVVLCNQLSPVMMAEAAVEYKKKYTVPFALYCLDLWPESLTVGGVKRNSLIYKIFHRISGRLYRQADRLFVTSRLFVDYLEKEFGYDRSKTVYLPQYAEELFSTVGSKAENGFCDLMFAGNIGELQNLGVVIHAAEELQDKSVRFHIVGGGIELEKIQGMASEKGLKNVIFYGRRPVEEMPNLYKQADAMLVTLIPDPVMNLVIPGKVQSYMACGKPIIGSIDGEASKVIHAARCGYCSSAGDVDGLVEVIQKFVNTNEKEVMGRNARDYYEKHFLKDNFIDNLMDELNAMSNRKEDIKMKNVLIVGAHYDDAELGAGGTAKKLSEGGVNVYKLTLTDNVTKSSHLHIDVDYETSVRESAMACEVLGVKEITDFASVPCTKLSYSTEMMQAIEDVIYNYDIDTNIEASKICLTAARHCRNVFYYQSNLYLPPHQFIPTYFVDISDYIDAKKEALFKYTGDHNRNNALFQTNIERNHIWDYSNKVEYAEGFMVQKYLDE